MRTDWTYEGCDEQEQTALEQYWQGVQSALESKLSSLPEVASELRVAVWRTEDNPAWELQAALHVPGQTLVAAGASERMEEAVDQLLHGLAEDVELLQAQPGPSTPRREGLEEMLPLLEEWHAQRHSAPFVSFLHPLVATLADYMLDELRVREVAGELTGEEVSVDDLLDELLVAAWTHFADRDRTIRLDLWLVQLAHSVLARLSHPAGNQSFSDDVPRVGRSAMVEDNEWLEQMEAAEVEELGDVLPGTSAAADWEDLDYRSKLAPVLARLTPEQRHALVLNLVHGFTLGEIADFQGRQVEQVEQDVRAAARYVRRAVDQAEQPDPEEPFERRTMRARRRRRG